MLNRIKLSDERQPNSFVVGLGAADGAFNIYALTPINFIVDLTGYFAP